MIVPPADQTSQAARACVHIIATCHAADAPCSRHENHSGFNRRQNFRSDHCEARAEPVASSDLQVGWERGVRSAECGVPSTEYGWGVWKTRSVRSWSPGASISHTKHLRDNLCPDWAILRIIVSRERPSLLRSAYGRNQHGKRKNGRRMRDFALVVIFFNVEFGHIRTAVEIEVRGKHMSKNSSIWA